MERLCPNILELITVFTRGDINTAWDLHIQDIVQAAQEEGVAFSTAHVQITALFNKKPTAKAPPRTIISYVIMPSMRLLNQIDSEGTMTAGQCLAAMDADLARFDAK